MLGIRASIAALTLAGVAASANPSPLGTAARKMHEIDVARRKGKLRKRRKQYYNPGDAPRAKAVPVAGGLTRREARAAAAQKQRDERTPQRESDVTRVARAAAKRERKAAKLQQHTTSPISTEESTS